MYFKKNVEAMRDSVREIQHYFVRIEVYLEKFNVVLNEIKQFSVRFDIIDQTESSHLEQRYRGVGSHLNEQQISEWKQKEKLRIIKEYNSKRNLIITNVLKKIHEDEDIIRKIFLQLRDIDEEREMLLQHATLIGNSLNSNSLIEVKEVATKPIFESLIIIKDNLNIILSLFNHARKLLVVLKEKYTLGESTKTQRTVILENFEKINAVCGELKVVFSNETAKKFISGIFETLSLIKDRDQLDNPLGALQSNLNLLESDLKEKKLW